MIKGFHFQPSSKWLLPLLLFLINLGILLATLKLSRAFTDQDSLRNVLPPAFAGFLFSLGGFGLYLYLFPRAGLTPLAFFFCLGGTAFIVFPEVRLNGAFASLYLLALPLIPALLLHFGWMLPRMLAILNMKRSLLTLPYGVGILLAAASLATFHSNPSIWVTWNRVALIYLAISYLAWLGYLLWIPRGHHSELEKIAAKYLLISQVLAFVLPSMLGGGILLWLLGLPPHWTYPLALLFPLALALGIVPAQRKQMQIYIVQSEKRVALGNLLAGLAHELNNPLNFVYSSLEPLKESIDHLKEAIPEPDEKTRKILLQTENILKRMEEGMSRAESLIETLREMPAGRRPEKEKVDLVALIDKCIALLSHKWKDRVQVETYYEAVPDIMGIPVELEQAFTNILANAIDATPGGMVEVSVFPVSAGVKVTIKDTGKGISREAIGKIFDPFFTTKSQGEGKGLGLAIALQIVKNHRGFIEVKSEVREGSEFTIFLPY